MAERKTLLKLKKNLELKLRSVQQQLQFLDNARKRLKAVLSERNCVLDLICRDSASARLKKSKNKDTAGNFGKLTVEYFYNYNCVFEKVIMDLHDLCYYALIYLNKESERVAKTSTIKK